MKKLIAVIVAAVVVGFAIYIHQEEKAAAERRIDSRIALDRAFTDTDNSIQAGITYEESRIIGYHFGPLAQMEYPRCGSAQLKANQEKCKRWKAYLKKADEDEKKNPSW